MKYDCLHQAGSEHGRDCNFLPRLHLQLCNTDDWEQQDCNIADKIDGTRDVSCRRVVAPSGNEGIPSLNLSSAQEATGMIIAPTFRVGVHEKINTINVLRYAQLTATMSAQLAQKINPLSRWVPSNMCLICSRMLILAE